MLPSGIVSTGWPAVAAVLAQLGIVFDPWQVPLGRAILGKRKDGKYAADAIVMSIPRQVGKTFILGWIIYALCIIRPGTLVIWTAHRSRTAAETFRSFRAMAQRPSVKPHILGTPTAAGEEAVIFRNGSRILFGARERGFGRGFTKVDVLMIDEAQILTPDAVDDMIPATNQADNPLIFYAGTPPRPKDPGDVFTSFRAEAIKGDSDDVLYVESSADVDADPLDRKQWAKANLSYPARTSERAILRMRKNLTADSFLREGLGIWDDTGAGAINYVRWTQLRNAKAKRPAGQWIVAVDVNPYRTLGTVAVAGYGRKGRVLVFVRTFTDIDDIAGFVDRQVMRRDVGEIVLHPGGQVGALLPDLKGSHGELVKPMTTTELGQACSWLQQAVVDGRVEHTGQAELDEAVRVARTRRVGEAEVFDRLKRDDEISPVVAAAEAAYRFAMLGDYDVAESIY